MAGFEEYLCSKFEEGLNLEIREKMSVSSSQNYKEMVQLTLRAEKLTNERKAKGKFRREKGLGSCLGSLLKKVKVLNLQKIHLDHMLSLLAHPRHCDLHNHLDLVQPRQVLLSEDELHQRDAHDVVNFILDLAVLSKCVFSAGRQVMSRGFVQCLILLLQWGKLWVSQEL